MRLLSIQFHIYNTCLNETSIKSGPWKKSSCLGPLGTCKFETWWKKVQAAIPLMETKPYPPPTVIIVLSAAMNKFFACGVRSSTFLSSTSPNSLNSCISSSCRFFFCSSSTQPTQGYLARSGCRLEKYHVREVLILLTLLLQWSSWNQQPWRVLIRARPACLLPCPLSPGWGRPRGIWRAPGKGCKPRMHTHDEAFSYFVNK